LTRDYSLYEIDAIFKRVRSNCQPSKDETASYQSAMLLELCRMNHARGWTQQLHFGVLRNNNHRMFNLLGPDTGYDSIGDFNHAASLSSFLNRLDLEGSLARTVLYNCNPADNAVMATMLGNFQEGPDRGKLQFGSGWWFLDQKQGMEAQMNDLSSMGLISTFIGMTTDSRSFLSFPRHEYFRRILCNLFGNDIRKGLIPDDMDLTGGIIQNICYFNVRHYLGFDARQEIQTSNPM